MCDEGGWKRDECGVFGGLDAIGLDDGRWRCLEMKWQVDGVSGWRIRRRWTNEGGVGRGRQLLQGMVEGPVWWPKREKCKGSLWSLVVIDLW